MKLIVVCKDDNTDKFNNDKEYNNNDNLIITCGMCKGEDTKTTIKMILEDYGDEIDEIIYPNCDIIKPSSK
ncbi:hypothetical protein [Methanothermococcus okinawensis]|nr:hypothetical protein [Methanothermococcus okinawensis]